MLSLDNTKIELIKTSDLEKLNLLKPDIQRIINKHKVEELVNCQLKYVKERGHFNISPSGPINIHILNGKKFLIDGQHRISAMERLYRDHSHDITFFVMYVTVDSISELELNYKVINMNTPLPDFTIFKNLDKKIPELVSSKFQDLYPTIWSKNSRARRPHLYFNFFQESLAFIVNELSIKDYNYLYKIIIDYNNILSDWEPSSFRVSDNVYKSAKEKGIYFGLFCRQDEDYVYEWAKKIVEARTGKIIKRTNIIKTKTKIPKKIKNDSWDLYIGNDIAIAPCICCRTEKINSKKFIAGHIISEKNGGHVSVDNILPICDGCNSSMGTTNMDLFIKEFYPGNYDKFKNKNYTNTNTNTNTWFTPF